MAHQAYRPIAASSAPLENPDSAPPTGHVLSKDEWEEIKPLIYRLYIEEEKSFLRIKPIITEIHGRAPTRNQFDKRVQRWGFRKNVSRADREAVSNGSLSGTRATQVIARTQNKRGTSRRPAREPDNKTEAGNANHRGMLLDNSPQIAFSGPAENAFNSSTFIQTNQIFQLDDLPSPTERGDPTPMIPTSLGSIPWPSVDVPGSPRLTRLLAALSLYSPTIEPLSLDQPRDDPRNTSEMVSTSSLQSLSRTNDNAVLPDNWSLYASRICDLVKQQARNSGQQAMKHNKADVFFPTGDWATPDPHHELYPFPPIIKQNRSDCAPAISTNFSIPTLKSRANSLNAYLASIKGTFAPNHPLILKTLVELANTFCEMSDHERASKLWSVVARRKESYEGPISPETVQALFMVLRNLYMLGEGKAKEADMLCDHIERLIQQNYPPDHRLAITFSWIKAEALVSRGLYAEGESLYRKSLQLRLTAWGPRSNKTTLCMAGLGRILSLKVNASKKTAVDGTYRANNLKESPEAKSSEFLVLTAMTLLHESEEPLDMNNELELTNISILIHLGRSEEALPTAEAGAERSRRDLGESHSTALKYQERLALIHLDQGRFLESIHIFQTILRLQNLDDTSSDAMTRMIGLGKALRGVNRHQEAIMYLEKTFRASLSVFGSLSNKTKDACWNLGDSYTQLEAYAKALETYHVYIQKIRIAAANGHIFVTEVQGWLDHVNQCLVASNVG